MANLVTETELCEQLKVSRTTLWVLRRKGLPFIRIGSLVRYEIEEVLNWFRAVHEPLAKEVRARNTGGIL